MGVGDIPTSGGAVPTDYVPEDGDDGGLGGDGPRGAEGGRGDTVGGEGLLGGLERVVADVGAAADSGVQEECLSDEWCASEEIKQGRDAPRSRICRYCADERRRRKEREREGTKHVEVNYQATSSQGKECRAYAGLTIGQEQAKERGESSRFVVLGHREE